jgi:RNA polymerase I-specific transcription initiation factor RRN7
VAQLTGVQAKELYLECLQLLLRKQVYALVHNKRLPAQLEAAVRDLWDLRIRGFGPQPLTKKEDGPNQGRTAKRASSKTSSVEKSDDLLVLYTSQSERDGSDKEDEGKTSRSKVQDWTSERPDTWKVPRLVETLALCYLACLLMRIPVRVGDMFRWAKTGQIVYMAAVSCTSIRSVRCYAMQWLRLS